MDCLAGIAKSGGDFAWRACVNHQYRKKQPFLFRLVRELELDLNTYDPSKVEDPENADPRAVLFRQYVDANLQLLVIWSEKDGYTTLARYFQDQSKEVHNLCLSLREWWRRYRGLDSQRENPTDQLYDLVSSFVKAFLEGVGNSAQDKFQIPGEKYCLKLFSTRSIQITELRPNLHQSLKRDVFLRWCDQIVQSNHAEKVRLANPLNSLDIRHGESLYDPDFIPVEIAWNSECNSVGSEGIDSGSVSPFNPWAVLIGEQRIEISLQASSPNIECPVEFTRTIDGRTDFERSGENPSVLTVLELKSGNYGLRLTSDALIGEGKVSFQWIANVPGFECPPGLTTSRDGELSGLKDKEEPICREVETRLPNNNGSNEGMVDRSKNGRAAGPSEEEVEWSRTEYLELLRSWWENQNNSRNETLPDLNNTLDEQLPDVKEKQASLWKQSSVKRAQFLERVRRWLLDPSDIAILGPVETPKGMLELSTIQAVRANTLCTYLPGQREEDFWTTIISKPDMPDLLIELSSDSPVELWDAQNDPVTHISVKKLQDSGTSNFFVRPTEASLYEKWCNPQVVRFFYRLKCSKPGHAEPFLYTFGEHFSSNVYFGDQVPPLCKQNHLHTLYRSWRLHRLFRDDATQEVNNSARPKLNECYQKLSLRGTKEEIKMTELVSRCQNNNSKEWVMFQGPAGVGKSTFFKHLAQSWSLVDDVGIGTSLKKAFKWVISIQLHHIMYAEHHHSNDDGNTVLAALLAKSFTSLKDRNPVGSVLEGITEDEAKLILRHFQNDTENILFLLDGCDEAKSNPFVPETGVRKESVGSKMFESLRRIGAIVFISSRFSSHVSDCDQNGHPWVNRCINRFVEIEGLRPEARDKFVEQYAMEYYVDSINKRDEFCGKLEQSFQENDRLASLSTNPTLLEAICFVYRTNDSTENDSGVAQSWGNGDVRVSLIYSQTVDHLLDRCWKQWSSSCSANHDCKKVLRWSLEEVSSRVGKDHDSTEKEISIGVLQEVFNMIKPSLPQDEDFENVTKANQYFEGLGLLKLVCRSGDEHQTYEFMHRSYWEYFLAMSKFHNFRSADAETECLVAEGMSLGGRFLAFFVSRYSVEYSAEALTHLLSRMYKFLMKGVKEQTTVEKRSAEFVELLLEVDRDNLNCLSLNQMLNSSKERILLLFSAGETGSFRLIEWIKSKMPEPQLVVSGTKFWGTAVTLSLNQIALAGAATGGHVHCCRALLKEDSEVFKVQHCSWAAIYIASRGGNHDCLELLLSHASEADTPDEVKAEALSVALWSRHCQCVTLLLTRHSGSINADKDKVVTPEHVFLAAKLGSLAAIRMMMNKPTVPPSSFNDIQGGYSLLFMAALNGHHELMKYLMESETNEYACIAHTRSQKSESIVFAAALSGNVKCLHVLQSAFHINLNIKAEISWTTYGLSPLHAACIVNSAECIKFFLSLEMEMDKDNGQYVLQLDSDWLQVGRSSFRLPSELTAHIVDEEMRNKVHGVYVKGKTIMDNCFAAFSKHSSPNNNHGGHNNMTSGDNSRRQANMDNYYNSTEEENGETLDAPEISQVQWLRLWNFDQPTITDDAFRHIGELTQVQVFVMGFCRQTTITDNAFRHIGKLSQLERLTIVNCNQYTITDDAFRHIGQISELQRLEIKGLNQLTISDDAFRYIGQLSQLQQLDMSECNQSTITDEAFRHIGQLSQLQMFNMVRCNQSTIVDNAFKHIGQLLKLRYLAMNSCNQTSITDHGFRYICHLSELQILHMQKCKQATITDDAFRYIDQLSEVQELNMSKCNQSTITDEAFQHIAQLSNLRTLDIESCNQSTITDDAFRHIGQLPQLQQLNMSGCNQPTITDDTFQNIGHLSQLLSLSMADCNQSTITDDALRHIAHLRQLQSVYMFGCDQSTITDGSFEQLSHVKVRTERSIQK